MASTSSTYDGYHVASPEEYYALLRDLAYKGNVFGKTKSIAAYSIQERINKRLGKEPGAPVETNEASATFRCQTLTNDGNEELATSTKLSEAYLCFDLQFHPDPAARERMVEESVDHWFDRLQKRDSEGGDIVASGIWVNKKKTLMNDYIPPSIDGEDPTIFKPNPEATRIGIKVKQDTWVPAPWSEKEFIGNGGYLVMREAELPKLMLAMEEITKKGTPASVALLQINGKGETVSRCDAYPTESGTQKEPKPFLIRNYAPMACTQDTFKMQNARPEGGFGFAVRETTGFGGKLRPASPQLV